MGELEEYPREVNEEAQDFDVSKSKSDGREEAMVKPGLNNFLSFVQRNVWETVEEWPFLTETHRSTKQEGA